MRLRTSGQICLIVLLGSISGWGADSASDIKEVKTTFQIQMRHKDPADRISAVEALGEHPEKEVADLLIKRGLADNDATVRQAAQRTILKLAEDTEIRKYLFDEIKKGLKKPVVIPAVTELVRCLALIDGEEAQQEFIKVIDEYLNLPKGNLLVPITIIDDYAKRGDATALKAVTLFSKSKMFEGKFGYRRCIVQAMTKIQDPEAVTFLILLMPQTNGLIQYDIVQYLTKLTSQKFKDNDRDWFKWWKENKGTFKFPKEGVPTEDVEVNDGKLSYYGIPVCAKRIVFVLDTSGSMRGPPIVAVKNALLEVVNKLPDSVNVDVVMFDSTAVAWKPRLVPATRVAKTEIASTVMNRGLGFGTASFAALDVAFKLEPEAIYFLSDGQPTDSQPDQIFNTFSTLNRTRRVSLHTIGVMGNGRNAAELILFMKPLAEQNWGTYRLVE